MSQAKCVILRVPENDMDYQDPNQFVRLYFKKLHPDISLDLTRHCIHLQPPPLSHVPQSNHIIHIIIDFEVGDFSGPLNENFQHEVYLVRWSDDDL